MNSHVKEACGSKTADLPVWSDSTQLPFSPLSEALFRLYWEVPKNLALGCVLLEQSSQALRGLLKEEQK